MTLWLDKQTLRTQVATYIDEEILEMNTKNPRTHRREIEIVFNNSVEFDAGDIGQIRNYMRAIGDGNPEMKISGSDDRLRISIEADASVYKDCERE